MKNSKMVLITFDCKNSLNLYIMISLFTCSENQDLLTSFKCTTCSSQLFLVNHNTIRFHPVLGVLVCKVILTNDYLLAWCW